MIAAEQLNEFETKFTSSNLPIEEQGRKMRVVLGQVRTGKVTPAEGCTKLKVAANSILSGLEHAAPCCQSARDVQRFTLNQALHISTSLRGMNPDDLPEDLKEDKVKCEGIVERNDADPFNGYLRLAKGACKQLNQLTADIDKVKIQLAKAPAANGKGADHVPTLALFQKFEDIGTTFLDATRQANICYVEGLNKDAAYVGPAAARLQAFQEAAQA